ncbi:MAG: hypothetical protein R6U94_06940, partial [Nitriliruptoraceae bacterium]
MAHGVEQAKRPVESTDQLLVPTVLTHPLPDVFEEETHGQRRPVRDVEVGPVEVLAIEGGEGSVDLPERREDEALIERVGVCDVVRDPAGRRTIAKIDGREREHGSRRIPAE